MAKTNTLTIEVEIPPNITFSELARIEDETSDAVGLVLSDHGLKRENYERRIVAEYSEQRNE